MIDGGRLVVTGSTFAPSGDAATVGDERRWLSSAGGDAVGVRVVEGDDAVLDDAAARRFDSLRGECAGVDAAIADDATRARRGRCKTRETELIR